MNPQDKKAVDVLRGLALDMIAEAKSGHPGIVLSAAPLLYALYKDHLNADKDDCTYFNRDRFVLSCGHGSALLYALLHLLGYPLPLDQLKRFRKLDSLTPGHPEVGHTPGVDCTAGPLGQGLAQAVGMALAESHLRALYPEGERLVDHYTYCLVGDGCLEEGISHEALSFAGRMHLSRLIVLYDKNDCTLDGPLSDSSSDDVLLRMKALNWNVLEVPDGNDVDQVSKAIGAARLAKDKPTLILCHTVIGYGSPYAGSHKSHGKAFSKAEVEETKKNLGIATAPFEVPEEVPSLLEETFGERGKRKHARDEREARLYQKDHPDQYALFEKYREGRVDADLFRSAPVYPDGFAQATRNTSHDLLALLHEKIPVLFGGSADVADSVMTRIPGLADYDPAHPEGRNVRFGIREFAMASIANGILLHGGLRPYVGSFLVFSDYMKGALRMSSMERLPVVYLFSHDSIAVGEDGPTHQPIEQLTMLRTIPNFDVLRPADARECAACYAIAFASASTPSALILSRQKLSLLSTSSFEGTKRGAYVVLREEKEDFDLVLIASGSEVSLALQCQEELIKEGIDLRVVSMPSSFLFDRQDPSYREDVLGKDRRRRLFVEMGKSDALYKYADHVYGIDDYGTSARAEDVLEKFRFTVPDLCRFVKSLLSSL